MSNSDDDRKYIENLIGHLGESEKQYIANMRAYAEFSAAQMKIFIDTFEFIAARSQFFESIAKKVLFYYGGFISIPKEVDDEFMSDVNNFRTNIQMYPTKDGNVEIWSSDNSDGTDNTTVNES